MRVLVTGSGHSGTTLLGSMFEATGVFEFYTQRQDDLSFCERKELPPGYAAKCVTDWPKLTGRHMAALQVRHSDFYVCPILRHPVSTCLAQRFRGRPEREGGDHKNKYGALTLERVLYNQTLVYDTLQQLADSGCAQRIELFFLEELLLDWEGQCARVARLCGGDAVVAAKVERAPALVRNKHQQHRYAGKLDAAEATNHERVYELYGGYFQQHRAEVERIQQECEDLVELYWEMRAAKDIQLPASVWASYGRRPNVDKAAAGIG